MCPFSETVMSFLIIWKSSQLLISSLKKRSLVLRLLPAISFNWCSTSFNLTWVPIDLHEVDVFQYCTKSFVTSHTLVCG